MRAKAKVERIFSKLYGEDVRRVPKYEILIECGLWPRPIDRELLIGREDGKRVIKHLLTDQDFYEKLPEGTKWENAWGICCSGWNVQRTMQKMWFYNVI